MSTELNEELQYILDNATKKEVRIESQSVIVELRQNITEGAQAS